MTEDPSSLEVVDIGWQNLDMKKFFLLNSTSIVCLRTCMYPQQVIKTRLQVQKGNVYKGMTDAFVKILKAEGFRGMYKGFLVTSIGFLPAQVAYIATLEFVREHFPRVGPNPDILRTLMAGFCSSAAAITITVPVDVVAQRLMVQDGMVNQYQYKGAASAFASIYQTEGIRGMYRGYGATIAIYGPSNAIWWCVYHTTKGALLPYYNNRNEILMNGVASVAAATTSAILTNPLDVSKTRLQVMQKQLGERKTIFTVLVSLWKEEGMKGMGRGLQARLVNMCIVSFFMITIYEKVKRMSVIS